VSADLYHIEFFAKQKHIEFAEGKYIKPSSARHIDKGKERTNRFSLARSANFTKNPPSLSQM